MFRACLNLTDFVIPSNITSIGRIAFAECKNLANIVIPDSVTNIGDKIFYGCDSVTIHAPARSYAESYAKENNIPFVAI
jgi:hypothetical protein